MGLRPITTPDLTPLEISTDKMQNTVGEMSLGSAYSEMFLENALYKAFLFALNRQQPASLAA
jgi:hypothetical protein